MSSIQIVGPFEEQTKSLVFRWFRYSVVLNSVGVFTFILQYPASTTYMIPSSVSDVSAMFVATTHFRRPSGARWKIFAWKYKNGHSELDYLSWPVAICAKLCGKTFLVSKVYNLLWPFEGSWAKTQDISANLLPKQRNPHTVTIWIPNTWIPDSSDYRTF